jgi:hypothetical protein
VGQQVKSGQEALDEWREAERLADAEDPASVEGQLARYRADRARQAFHEAENEEFARQFEERADKQLA